jgi:hypothetical protein
LPPRPSIVSPRSVPISLSGPSVPMIASATSVTWIASDLDASIVLPTPSPSALTTPL